MTKTHNTRLCKDPTMLILCGLALIFSVIMLSVYLARVYDLKLFGFLFSLAFILLLFILSSKLKKKFLIKDVLLEFDDRKLTIEIYYPNANEPFSKQSFLWKDIKSYKFYFDTKNNTCLTLHLKTNPKRRVFFFMENLTFDEAINQDSVFSIFLSFVKNQNQMGQNIIPVPSFLATNTGKIIIWLEVLFILFAFGLHVMYHNFSNSFYLLLGIVLLIPQIINRKQNVAAFERIRNLGNVSK